MTMNLPSHNRYDYQPITRRPSFGWPEGSGLAVYFGVNLEHFAFGEGMGASLAPGGPQPDVLNYAWRDYGNRVGAWRMLELFDGLKVPTGVLANSAIADYCPELLQAFIDRGDELIGHGRTNSERQADFDETGEMRLITESRQRLRQFSGHPPAGWLGPWISQNATTPDLLREAGFTYLLDWCHDDQPVWMRTSEGKPILSVPYPQEINDIPAIVARQNGAAEFADMIIDQFDEMLDQARAQPLVMGIALHPYIVGQPFRLRHLRRALEHICAQRDSLWITTPGRIAEVFAEQVRPDV